jgi:hypothetical protein
MILDLICLFSRMERGSLSMWLLVVRTKWKAMQNKNIGFTERQMLEMYGSTSSFARTTK